MQFLEQLRSKSNHMKAQIAFASAVMITGIIGLVWVSTLPAQFNKIGEEMAKDDTEQTASAGTAFDEIIKKATEGLEALDDAVETEGAGDAVDESLPPIPQGSAFNKLEGWWEESQYSATSGEPIPLDTTTVPEQVAPPVFTPPPVQNTAPEPTPPAVEPIPTPAPASTPVSQPVAAQPEGYEPVAPSTPSMVLIGTTTKKTE